MTNGEKLEQVFPDGICPFSKSWLDYEYKEPLIKVNQDLTKNKSEIPTSSDLSSGTRKNSKKLEKDCISRAKAIEEADKLCLETGYDNEKVIEMLNELPSVTIRPKGHWYIDERPESDREIICSNCEQPIFKYYKLDFDYRPEYCPNCGADMESEVGE